MADWSGRPAYLQVADDLRAGILKGRFPPGSQLPSYGVLMKRYGVSVTVVRSAVRELRTESLVRTHQGKGVFVNDQLPAIRHAEPEPPAETAARVEKLESDLAALRETVALLQAQLINLYHSTGQSYPYGETIAAPGRQAG